MELLQKPMLSNCNHLLEDTRKNLRHMCHSLGSTHVDFEREQRLMLPAEPLLHHLCQLLQEEASGLWALRWTVIGTFLTPVISVWAES